MKTTTYLIAALMLTLTACGGEEDYSAYADTPEGLFVSQCSGQISCSSSFSYPGLGYDNFTMALVPKGAACVGVFEGSYEVKLYPDGAARSLHGKELTWQVTEDGFEYRSTSGVWGKCISGVHGYVSPPEGSGGSSGGSGGAGDCRDDCLLGCVEMGLWLRRHLLLTHDARSQVRAGPPVDVDQMLSKLVGKTGFWCGLVSTADATQAVVLTEKT